ncbi:hypothetical protein GA0061093_13237 [Rhodococcus qingshengii]|nr:hypothetical protein GA0061093_13237 [Rhodococcus qingshengii]
MIGAFPNLCLSPLRMCTRPVKPIAAISVMSASFEAATGLLHVRTPAAILMQNQVICIYCRTMRCITAGNVVRVGASREFQWRCGRNRGTRGWFR